LNRKEREQEKNKTQIYVVRQYAYVHKSAAIFNNNLGLQHNIFITKPLLRQLAILLLLSYYSLYPREYEPFVPTTRMVMSSPNLMRRWVISWMPPKYWRCWQTNWWKQWRMSREEGLRVRKGVAPSGNLTSIFSLNLGGARAQREQIVGL